jgi:hypothetical protein
VIRPDRVKPLNGRPERRKAAAGLRRKFDAYARRWTGAAGA